MGTSSVTARGGGSGNAGGGGKVGGSARRPRKKRAGRYHHGDLRRALVDQALHIIDTSGAEGLTLRGVGDALGVSRTALYRHFSDKQALLAAVAAEGFRTLRLALTEAWQGHGRGRAGFLAMGEAYVQFAVAHPSHHRVMFGRFVESELSDVELATESNGAFQVLVDALVEQQREGQLRDDDPVLMAQFVWSAVHGLSMLLIDGRLGDCQESSPGLARYVSERIRRALERQVFG